MIEMLRKDIPIVFLCNYFGASKSGYYAWKNRNNHSLVRKECICKQIKSIFTYSKGTYGSPRVYRELISQGVSISENTVAKYMQELSLDARLKKKFRVQTTNSNHSDPIAPRRFKYEEALPTQPYQILAGDITYLRLGTDFIYLAIVMDLYNRQVLGWSVSDNLRSKLVIDAMKMGLANCSSTTRIIFHSDRGSQYASEAFLSLIDQQEVLPSMSRRGNCYDNCYVESWFKSLKSECIYRQNYNNEKDLKALVFEYIETWYNNKRRHSSLGYVSPMEYKRINAVA